MHAIYEGSYRCISQIGFEKYLLKIGKVFKVLVKVLITCYIIGVGYVLDFKYF